MDLKDELREINERYRGGQDMTVEEMNLKLRALFELAVEKGTYGVARDCVIAQAAYSMGKPANKIEVTHDSTQLLREWLKDRRPIFLEDMETIDVLPAERRQLTQEEGEDAEERED